MIERTSYINNHNMLLSNDEIKRIVDMRLDFSNSTVEWILANACTIWSTYDEAHGWDIYVRRTTRWDVIRRWYIDHVYDKNRQVIYPSWDMSDMIIIDEAVNNAIEENIWEWDIWNE